MRARKSSNLIVFMVLALTVFISATCLTSEAIAKTRVNVGWIIDECLDDLIPDATWQLSSMCMFWMSVYSQLWMLGPPPNYDPTPALADRWETDDGYTWRFYLKKNAVFHDGHPVTAKDVLFTLEYLIYSDPIWWLTDSITYTKKNRMINKHTVEFTLKKPHRHPKYCPIYWIPILPEHIWKKYRHDLFSYDNAEAIGSGPWKLKQFVPGEFIWFDRFEEYFDKKPGFDEMVWRVYGSEDARLLAMRSGEIDFFGYSDGITPRQQKMFENNPDFDLVKTQSTWIDWLSFNFFKKYTKKLNFRKAVMHGISKERLCKIVYFGQAQPHDSFAYPGSPAHNPNLPQYEYNPEKARKLLAADGLVDTDGDGIVNDPQTKENATFDLMVSSEWASQIKAGRMIIEQLKEIGLDFKLIPLDEATYLQFLYDPEARKFDIAMAGEEPGPYGDWAHQYARAYDRGGKGWSTSGYSSWEYDKALDNYLLENDADKKREYVFEMERILAEDLPYGFISSGYQIDVINKKHVKDYVASDGGFSNWNNAWTLFWMKPADK